MSRVSKELKRPGSTSVPGPLPSSKPVMLDPHKDTLSDARQHLESSEELFRLSLIAKNEEITQRTDEVKANRDELDEENKLVTRLLAQVTALKEKVTETEAVAKKLASENEHLKAEIVKETTLFQQQLYETPLPSLPAESEGQKRAEELQTKLAAALREKRVQDGVVMMLKDLLALHDRSNNNNNNSKNAATSAHHDEFAIRAEILNMENQLAERDTELSVLLEREKLLRTALGEREEETRRLRQAALAHGRA